MLIPSEARGVGPEAIITGLHPAFGKKASAGERREQSLWFWCSVKFEGRVTFRDFLLNANPNQNR